MNRFCYLIIVLLLSSNLWGQTNDTSVVEIAEVVITATRTEKTVESIPAPIKIITGEQIRQMGSLRLNEVLQEQTGLAIVTDHGTGIQMQGLNPEYTMILIDGEPMVGRTAGTFDLTRLAIGNIKRIEIVKGPSSSLYGSEALAGVINIITENATKQGVSTSIKPRVSIGEHGYYVTDLSADVQMREKKLSVYAFINRYATGGYRLDREASVSTIPPFQNYTGQFKINYDYSPRTQLSLSTRYFIETSQGTIEAQDEKSNVFLVNQEGRLSDLNINTSLRHKFSEKWTQYVRIYGTQYKTKSAFTKVSDGSFFEDSHFNQGFYRPETQADYKWNCANLTTGGAGISFETVEATRYTSKKEMNNLYAYLQHDVKLFQRLNMIGGLRMDNHNIYGSRVSPKLSASLEAATWLTFKASAGQGFKAPDFRQIYLNFTNPVVGYSVFGTEEIHNQMALLQARGEIRDTVGNLNSLKPLKAEYSTAYNIGFTVKPMKKIKLDANFFRNDINDMINTVAVAVKTNNQSVFTYTNLNKVYTQGLETELSYQIHKAFLLSAGYQYLDAKDKDVIERIENGTVFARDPHTFVTQKLTQKDYGGLFNRSKQSGNAKISYCNTKHHITGTLRCMYRGKYGFLDKNGNGVLDNNSDEYVGGYFIWNASMTKEFKEKLVLQLGVNNIGNFTNATYIPSQPGRVVYLSLQFKFSKSKTDHI